MFEALHALQTLPVDQLPQTASGAPWGESIADEVAWAGFFLTVRSLGRRWLMGTLLPDEMPAVDLEAMASDRDPHDRWRLWVLFAIGTVATTLGVYLLSTIAFAALWFGGLAFIGSVAALWGYRGGTPLDDIRLLAAARSNNRD